MHIENDFVWTVSQAKDYWKQLAEDFGVSVNTVKRWATGKSSPIIGMKLLIVKRIAFYKGIVNE